MSNPLTRGARAAPALLVFLAVSCAQKTAPAPTDLPPPSASEEDWNRLKQRSFGTLGVADGWEAPELLAGDVNTIGWEDSSYITPDGSAVYWFYFPGDLFHIGEVFHFHTPVAQGGLGKDAAHYSRYHRGPVRGVSPLYTSDIFHARLQGKRFTDVREFPHSADGRNEWGVMKGPDGAWYYVSHDPTKEMNKDVYRGDSLLPIPGREKYHEDNPHFAVTSFGRELFFDCDNRPASGGKSRIWVTRETDTGWTEPVMLPAPVNAPGSTEVQPFLTSDDHLFFGSARDGVVAIYASRRTGADAWATPQKVLWPTVQSGPRLWGLGEPTLTKDGRWLYFVAVFVNQDNRFDCDVARIRRAGR